MVIHSDLKELRVTNNCKKVAQLALEKGIEITRFTAYKFLMTGKNSELFVAVIL